MGSRDQTWVVSLGNKHPHLLSHLCSPKPFLKQRVVEVSVIKIYLRVVLVRILIEKKQLYKRHISGGGGKMAQLVKNTHDAILEI